MKRLKVWHIAVAAFVVTALSGIVPSATQYSDGIPRWGWPFDYSAQRLPVGHLFSNPIGFLFDFIIYFGLIWILNRIFLRKRK